MTPSTDPTPVPVPTPAPSPAPAPIAPPPVLDAELQKFLAIAQQADADAQDAGSKDQALAVATDAAGKSHTTLATDNQAKQAQANVVKALIDHIAQPSTPPASGN